MAKNFELNLEGLREVMKSGEMQSALDAAGSAVASAAGTDYGHRTHLHSFVAICNVYPTSLEANNKAFEEKTLLKAAGAVGLPTKG